MNFTKTSNPFFGKNAFQRSYATAYDSDVMTVNGVMSKTILMLLFVLASAFFTWQKFFEAYTIENPVQALSAIKLYIMVGGFGGFIVAMITSFAPRRSAFLTPIYAILEGTFLGGISAMFEAQYPGLVIRAVALTFAVFFCMLVVYRQQIIKVNSQFVRGMMAAMFGLMLVYLVGWIMGMFGMNVAFLYGSGRFGIGFSLIVVAISAFSLLLDFDFVERGAMAGAPKYMEWYGVFGLLVSLVWLYINMLRLLAALSRRN
jgi:uncharacterized YccA/Bax inhibitor family protein